MIHDNESSDSATEAMASMWGSDASITTAIFVMPDRCPFSECSECSSISCNKQDNNKTIRREQKITKKSIFGKKMENVVEEKKKKKTSND